MVKWGEIQAKKSSLSVDIVVVVAKMDAKSENQKIE